MRRVHQAAKLTVGRGTAGLDIKAVGLAHVHREVDVRRPGSRPVLSSSAMTMVSSGLEGIKRSGADMAAAALLTRTGRTQDNYPDHISSAH